jgi:hypothetical protein
VGLTISAKSDKKTRKAVLFGCTHHPLQDPAAIGWVLDLIAAEKPDDIGYLGDGIEGNAASRWDDAVEMDIALEREFDTHNAFLAEIRKAAPKARRYYCAGNHDGNLLKGGRIDKRLRSLCDWSNPKNQPEWREGEWTLKKTHRLSRKDGCLWLGPQVCLAHGWATAAPKIDREAMYFLANAPFGLYATAHTHQPRERQQVRFGSLPMNRWHLNVGCLRDMDPEYMERCEKWNWGQAAAVVEYVPLKSPRMCREWDADLRVFRMYDDLECAA